MPPLGPCLAGVPIAEDWIARGIGLAGVLLAALGIGLTYFLWYRSGPHLKTTAFVRAETGTVHIEVSNVGRLAATVRNIELRDHLRLSTQGNLSAPTHRWTLRATPNGAALPCEVPPSGFIDSDVDIKSVLVEARNLSEISVTAWAQRGDGKWYVSSPVPYPVGRFRLAVKDSVDCVRGLLVKLRDHVAVGAQRQRDVGVSKPLHDHAAGMP
jgi:hypothetical protein